MGTQISLQLSHKIFASARDYAEHHGFDTLQDFIRETVREKLFEKDEQVSGILTAIASEKALAKNWLTKEEDDAWAHLQEGT
jgi:hypothetical protein